MFLFTVLLAQFMKRFFALIWAKSKPNLDKTVRSQTRRRKRVASQNPFRKLIRLPHINFQDPTWDPTPQLGTNMLSLNDFLRYLCLCMAVLTKIFQWFSSLNHCHWMNGFRVTIDINGCSMVLEKVCQRLQKIAKSCQKLPRAAKSCQKLSKVAKSSKKLQKVAKSC